MKPKIIVIVGPTASGKSGLAVEVAKKYGGEIISADSRQIYRKLDIGTAKITKDEMAGVPHHLIDIVDIADTYTAVDFKKDATQKIKEIKERGNIPIIAGGTFFYVDVLLDRVSAPAIPPNNELREGLEKKSVEALFAELEKKDPARATNIDSKNKRRLIRALEIIEAVGKVPLPKENESPFDVLMIGITTSKEDLRARIRARAPEWLKNGFIEETKSLLASNVSKERLAEIGFEYQIAIEYIEGKLTDEQFIQTFEEKNWQYAKRQLTWLKRDKSIHWMYLSERQETELLIHQFLMEQ